MEPNFPPMPHHVNSNPPAEITPNNRGPIRNSALDSLLSVVLEEAAKNTQTNTAPAQNAPPLNDINEPKIIQMQERKSSTGIVNAPIPNQQPNYMNVESLNIGPPYASIITANGFNMFQEKNPNSFYVKVNKDTNSLLFLSSLPQDKGVMTLQPPLSILRLQPQNLTPVQPVPAQVQQKPKRTQKPREKKEKPSRSSSPKPPHVSAFEKDQRPPKKNSTHTAEEAPAKNKRTQLTHNSETKQADNAPTPSQPLPSLPVLSPIVESKQANIELGANTETKESSVTSTEKSIFPEDSVQKKNEQTQNEVVQERGTEVDGVSIIKSTPAADGDEAACGPQSPPVPFPSSPFSDVDNDSNNDFIRNTKRKSTKKVNGVKSESVVKEENNLEENGKDESPERADGEKKKKKVKKEPTLPLKVNKWLQINSLGYIPENEKEIVVIPYTRKKYRPINVLWPIGFEATRKFTNYLHENMCVYKCSVAKNAEWNVEFRIVNESDPQNPIVARTPFAAVKELISRIRRMPKRQKKGFCFRSPAPFFGISYEEVRDLISKLPNYPADLDKYVFNINDNTTKYDSDNEDSDSEMTDEAQKLEAKQNKRDARTRPRTRSTKDEDGEEETKMGKDSGQDNNNGSDDDSATETESEPEEKRIALSEKSKMGETLDGVDFLNPHFLRSKMRFQQQRMSSRHSLQKRERRGATISLETLKKMQEDREEQIAAYEDIIESARRAVMELQRTNSEWLTNDNSRVSSSIDNNEQNWDYSSDSESEEESTTKRPPKGNKNKISVKSKAKSKFKPKQKRKK